MSSHRVPKVCRNPFHKERAALNGKPPPATEFRRRADSFNYLLGYQKKMWTCRAMDLNNVGTPAAADVAIWNTDVRTGEATDELWCYLGMVKTDATVVLGIQPTFKIEAYPSGGGALVSSVEYTFNQTASSAAIVPDDIGHTRLTLDGLSANTAYEIQITRSAGMRCVYAMIVEARSQVLSTSTTGVCDPGSCRVEGDIDDANIGKLIASNNAMWRHCGAPILNWAADAEIGPTGGAGGCPVITGNTSYTDIYTNRAFTLDTRYRATLMRTAIPVVIAVTSNRISGTGTLDVRLTDGTNHLAVTGIADGGAYGLTTRYTATTTMPAALTTGWHLEAKQSDAGTTHELYSFTVYPFEA